MVFFGCYYLCDCISRILSSSCSARDLFQPLIMRTNPRKIDIYGVLSEEGYLDILVLQNSILGPILFLCFINDIFTVMLLLTLLFADDTIELDLDQDLHTLVNRVNDELNKLANWFRANKMAFNISKTKYIIFHPKGLNINLQESGDIEYNDIKIRHLFVPSNVTALERVHNNILIPANRSYTLLGMYLDECLSFDDHIKHVCNKVAHILLYIREKYF
jgi:hypothetical protein